MNNGFDSGSAWFNGSPFPQGEFIYTGYDIAVHLTGWCLFITKEAYKKIGKIGEELISGIQIISMLISLKNMV